MNGNLGDLFLEHFDIKLLGDFSFGKDNVVWLTGPRKYLYFWANSVLAYTEMFVKLLLFLSLLLS